MTPPARFTAESLTAFLMAALHAGGADEATADAATRAMMHASRLAVGAPLPGERPWLLDMATSAIPMNRVLLYRSLGLALPDGVAADEAGRTTTDPHAATVLSPLGGAYGYKGAGLAGLVEILSAPL